MITARPRTELQAALEALLGTDHVYFQPPANFTLTYPCIVYTKNKYSQTFANNNAYLRRTRYTVILIDKNPDSQFAEKILELPYCLHSRKYVADNLNHDVYDLYW